MSIDNLLNSQPKNKELSICGKLAIARTILNAERASLLSDKQFTNIDRARNTFNFHPLTNTWYIPFFQTITGNQKVEALEEHFQNLTLIIFNYDRCVERFLFLALKRFYNHLPDEKISSLIGTIKIYHPYGKVGDLPWQNPEQSTAYGADIHARELLSLASRIKTFTEGTDPNSSQIVEIRQQMAEAENLVFLGFAFWDINMDLIKPSPAEPLCSIQCYATALGLSESSIEAVIGDIRSLYTGNAVINVKKINCFDFFHEYNRKLGR